MLRPYFYKLLRSPMFYISVAGIVVVCWFSRTSFGLGTTIRNNYVVGEFEIFFIIDAFRKVVAVLGAAPFAANFADEWNSAVTNACVTRCGARKYAVSNVVMCYLSSLITVFLGMLLFACTLMTQMPLLPDREIGNGTGLPPYDKLLFNGLPFAYIAVKSLLFAVGCAMWSVMGMLLSAFFPNKYVAICSPFVASYIIERFTLDLPPALNLYALSVTSLGWENAWLQFLYSVGMLTLISGVCGAVFVIIVKRRVQNEIT